MINPLMIPLEAAKCIAGENSCLPRVRVFWIGTAVVTAYGIYRLMKWADKKNLI